MICGSCQAENRADRKFCLRCGSPLATRCPTCGAPNEPDAAFCGDCGTRLGGQAAGVTGSAAAPVGTASEPSRPGSAAPAAPIAERRLVSVLFADVVGYTTVAEGLDADDARELLDRYFRAARDVIERYGGVVEKFIGDAVMAVWGAPTAHEDDAERAVRAALDLVVMAPGIRPSHRAGVAPGRAPAGLQLRAGVLTGEAAVTIGADGQGMVAGDLVNTAARLQSAAEAGTVLVGESTMRAAAGAIAFEPAGDQVLKGKQAPVAAWRAVSVVAMRGGAGRSDQIEPPFVGRDAEFSALKERLHATARDRRARLVSVTGVAGIGKSRLAWELEKYIDGVVEDVYWHHGRSPAYGEGLAFWALGEMIRRRAGIAERDDAATTGAKLNDCLATFVPDPEERRWIAPRLRTLLGLEEGAGGSREETFAAWRTFFERIADRGTTILVFEDLQWADEGLVDFIESILEWSRAKPLLIVTLARPELLERRPTWGVGQREFTSLYLQPLSRAAMTEMVNGMAPGTPGRLVDQIADRSEGIPLYAVELFRMLLDRGDLVAEGGGYRVATDVADLRAPETLQALIAARLDALPPAERRVLQDASVLGKTFTLDSLAAISSVDRADLEPILRALGRRELLSVELDPRSPERGQYGFVGALVRETAYGTLARRDRRDRHLAAARYFEALGDDELAGILASHYSDAYAASAAGAEADAVAVQARLALRGAAERSLAVASPAQAAGYLRQALAVTADPLESARLYEDMARADQQAGNWAPSEQAASEALARFDALGDTVGAARAAALVGEALLVRSDIEGAIIALRRALAGLADDATPEGIAIRAQLARAELFLARPADALPIVEVALAEAARLDLVPEIADLLVTRAWALSLLGRNREVVATLQGVIAMAVEHGLHRVRFRAVNNLAATVGDWTPGLMVPLMRDAMADAERLGDRDWVDKLAFVALFAIWTGDWAYAESVVAARWRDDLPILSWAAPAAARVEIDAMRGDTAGAASLAQEIRRRTSRSDSTQDQFAPAIAEFYVAWAADDRAATRDAARRVVAAATDNSGETAEGAFLLGVAGAGLDDPALIAEALAMVRHSPTRTVMAEAFGRSLEAALAARSGRLAEAATLHAAAVDDLRRLGHELFAVFADLDLAGLLPPDDPVAQRAAGAVRRFAEATGATVIGQRLAQRLELARRRAEGAGGRRPLLDQSGTAGEQNVLTTS